MKNLNKIVNEYQIPKLKVKKLKVEKDTEFNLIQHNSTIPAYTDIKAALQSKSTYTLLFVQLI